MTMRLDIVTNDAGELVRREHARELGAGVVVAIYRLVKLAQMHDLGNQAIARAIDQAHQLIGEYGLRSGSDVNVLFADRATFVAGQLLKGNRGAYEAASELASLFERLGGSELLIARDITRDDCAAFAEQISLYHRTGNASQLHLPPRIRLRQVADNARLRGIELEHLSPDERIVRTYASAVVIMRRFFEDLATSRYVLPRRIKRIAQSLVDLSDASAASFLGVTEVRNANHDEAGRAVNTAILAVSIARESTHDRATLSQIAMAAMMHDVSRPRAMALAGAGGAPMPGMAGPTMLSEDHEDRLAAGAAAVLTALGRVNEPTITRTVLAFEALWLRRQTWLGPVYWGARSPTLHATILAVARRYNDLLTPEPGLAPPTTDFAIATLANELTEPQDRTVLRMLVSALGLLPTGTLVQLSGGEVAEVTRGARGLGDRPKVKLVKDAQGANVEPVEIDLAHDARRVHRVLGVDGWQKGLAQRHDAAELGPDSGPEPDIHVSMMPMGPSSPPALAQAPVLFGGTSEAPDSGAAWGEPEPNERPRRDSTASSSGISAEHASGASKSFGSSPSAVAEAMGRMIHDSLAPPAVVARQTDRPDRTVVQPGLDEARSPTHAHAPASGGQTAEPTARGNLAATPLPHVLVYMLDHALTGSVVFEGTRRSPDGPEDTVYFVNGVPAKVRLGEQVALLGEVLAEDGALDASGIGPALEGARRLGILLGEYLVGHDLVTREALAWSLEGQLLRKIGHVANLAPELEYAFYRDGDLLTGWGGEVVVSHPLNPILASVRSWTDRARVRATLNRIGKHPLALHGDSDLTNIAVIAEEQIVLDAIRAESMTLAELVERNLADEEVVSSLVYCLAVTRQFAFKGQKKGPMAARGPAWRSTAPGSPSTTGMRVSIPASSNSLASASASASAASAGALASSGEVERRAVPAAAGAPSRAPALASRASTPRAIAPAVRPASLSGARGGVPQIRPIARKTDSAANVAASSSSSRIPVAAPPPPPPPPPPPDVGESDDAKTIALMSPAAKLSFPLRSAAPAARPPATGGKPLPLPSASRMAAAPKPAPTAAVEDGAALDPMASFRLAEAALQRSDLVAAEEHARRALDADPSQADYVILVAWIGATKGGPESTEAAIATLSAVLGDDPGNQRALLYRGRLFARANRTREALVDFKALLAKNPSHREAQNEVQKLAGRLPPG